MFYEDADPKGKLAARLLVWLTGLVFAGVADWGVGATLAPARAGALAVFGSAVLCFSGQLAVTLFVACGCAAVSKQPDDHGTPARFLSLAIWLSPAALLIRSGPNASAWGLALAVFLFAAFWQHVRRREESQSISSVTGFAMVSLLVECGAAALSAREKEAGLLCLTAGAFGLAWNMAVHTPFPPQVPSLKQLSANTAAAAFTVIACSFLLTRGQMLPAGNNSAADAAVPVRSPHLHDGIILRPEHTRTVTLIAPPPKAALHAGLAAKAAEPFHIPFSGEYWIYHMIGMRADRPPPTSLVESGDPTEWNFTGPALAMKAHQNLEGSIDIACCDRILVRMTDADTNVTAYAVQLILRDADTADAVMIGIREAVRGPKTSVADFVIPIHPGLKRFNAIDVLFHLYGGRRNQSANVAVDEFELVSHTLPR